MLKVYKVPVLFNTDNYPSLVLGNFSYTWPMWGSYRRGTLAFRQPTLWLHELCQDDLTLQGWTCFGPRNYPYSNYLTSNTSHSSNRNYFYVFSYDVVSCVWTNHFPDNERIRYVLLHIPRLYSMLTNSEKIFFQFLFKK